MTTTRSLPPATQVAPDPETRVRRNLVLVWMWAFVSVRLRLAARRWWSQWNPSAVKHRAVSRLEAMSGSTRLKWQTFAVTVGLVTAGVSPVAGAAEVNLDGGRAVNDGATWLPAWRWAGHLRLQDDYGKVTDALNIDRIFTFFAQMCFMLTNFLWTVLLVLIERAADLNLVHDLSEWINELYAKVAKTLVTVDGGRGGILWLILMLAVLSAVWKAVSGRRHGLLRSMAKVFIPLALLLFISQQSINSAQMTTNVNSALERSGFISDQTDPTQHVSINTVGSAGWLATTGMEFTDGLLGIIPSSLGMTGQSALPSSDVTDNKCKRYLDVLHQRYQQDVINDKLDAPQSDKPGAFSSTSALMEVTSSMWETTVLQSWARTQFGNTEQAMQGACWMAEHNAGTKPVQQIDVWNQAVPELAVGAGPGTGNGGSTAAAGWFYTGEDKNQEEATTTFMAWCRKSGGPADHAPPTKGQPNSGNWSEDPAWRAVWERQGGEPGAVFNSNPKDGKNADFAGTSPQGACDKFWYNGDQTPGDGEGFPGKEVYDTAVTKATECASQTGAAASNTSATAGVADTASNTVKSVGNFFVDNPLVNPLGVIPAVNDAQKAAVGATGDATKAAVTAADPRAFVAGGTKLLECMGDMAFNWQVYVARAQDTGPFLFVEQQAVEEATTANRTDSWDAREYLNGLNGKGGMDKFLIALLTLITTLFMVAGLGGMVLGMVFVQIQALLGWIFLPFALLCYVLPGEWGNTLAKRVFRMLLAAMFAKTVYALGFTVLLTLINLLYRIANNAVGGLNTSTPILSAVFVAGIPLLAIWGLRKFAKNIGLDSFTSFRGAMNMPKMVMAGTAPGLDRMQRHADDRFGGMKRGFGQGAGLAAMSAATGGKNGQNPLDLMKSRQQPKDGTNGSRPPLAGQAAAAKNAATAAGVGSGMGAGAGDGAGLAALGAGAAGMGGSAGLPDGGMPGLPGGAAGGAANPNLPGLPGGGSPGSTGAPALGSGGGVTPGAAEVNAAASNPTVQKYGPPSVGMNPDVQQSIDARAAGTSQGHEALQKADRDAATAQTRPEMQRAMGAIDQASPAVTGPQPQFGQKVDGNGSVVGDFQYTDTADRATAHLESAQGSTVSSDSPVVVSEETQTAMSRPEERRVTPGPRPPAGPATPGSSGRPQPPLSTSGTQNVGAMEHAIQNSTAAVDGLSGAAGGLG